MDIEEIHEKFWAERRAKRGFHWAYWLVLIPVFFVCFEVGKYFDHKLQDNPGSSLASLFLPVVPLPTPVRRVLPSKHEPASVPQP